MENINSDILKLTTVLESTYDCNESCSSDDEDQSIENIPSTNTDTFLSESITTDEDTLFIIETCSDPLMKTALICNIKKRNILNELIKILEENLTKVKKVQRENFMRSKNALRLNKKFVIRKRLGIPYFKDANFFPSPSNDDYLLMQKNKHFSIAECVKKENWTSFHKFELVKGVFENVCANKIIEIQSEIRKLEKLDTKDKENLIKLKEQLIILNKKELIGSLAKQWQYILVKDDGFIYIKNKLINKTDDSHFIISLINDTIITESNWHHISFEHFDLKFTPMECKSMWNCYLHPKFSKEPWKEVDNVKLQEIAASYNHENWELIANELNIQKSPYQCCIHFYSKLYDKFLRTKWTVEEEKLLNELVEASRIGDYINWTKIAHYFRGRTKSQIYSHYYQAMLPSLTKGTFTVEEDVLLLTLLKLHNNDMKKVKLYFPERSLCQLRDRFVTMSRDDSQDWTLKDDCRIIEHVEQQGTRKWYLLHDMNRSNACIRHRYTTLKKYFEQNPKDDIQDVPRRYKQAYRRKIKLRFNLLNTAVQYLLNIVKKNPPVDDKTIFNLTYIHKNVLNAIPVYKSLKKNKNNTILYKNKSKNLKQKSTNSEGTLHHYCVNFFQPSSKKITRGKFYVSNEDFVAKAKRVMNILELLGAQLNLPKNEDEINKNLLLTSSDKCVLHEIVKEQYKINEKFQFQYLIPPTPETLIGLRGLMLHSITLRSHSRGNYDGYHFYVYPEQFYEKKGITYVKRRNDVFLSGLKDEEKQMFIRDQVLFWKRLKVLFTWPCIMQDTTIEPVICEAPVEKPQEIIPVQVPKKRGRPIKSKTWKIDVMNKARLEKKVQVDSKPQLNSSIDLINLPSTSKTENTYQFTKHDLNSYSIEFKHVPETSTSFSGMGQEQDEFASDSDDDDDGLDEDIQKLMRETDSVPSRIANNAVINQMSRAIETILIKTEPNIENTNASFSNKRKGGKVVAPIKKIKIEKQF